MIKRYKTLEEASRDMPRFISDLRRLRRSPVISIRPIIKCPRGIKRFRTMEDANKHRQDLIANNKLATKNTL